ncbi:MAG: hypothetical protein COT91_03110 [Candidatus Doudnabacteria bacterium CG10_big_fil_rev_8_21_14_0_10_41_10]|uniref:Uncharacterized protein n=1 Tax=Candidatus Doudnabacteria bacterium CG10_big_fil_rev_8_21_14_0_10_41_10 TaxID=1974551 RepID=A0A2H0VDC5_9BACT|nr:MAG: hypothetical protein COT91_03110 [Candidatus Doudnabacteria bacterium CG10_big_fil_rev_8_21_14_0_10_41_10]
MAIVVEVPKKRGDKFSPFGLVMGDSLNKEQAKKVDSLNLEVTLLQKVGADSSKLTCTFEFNGDRTFVTTSTGFTFLMSRVAFQGRQVVLVLLLEFNKTVGRLYEDLRD